MVLLDLTQLLPEWVFPVVLLVLFAALVLLYLSLARHIRIARSDEDDPPA